MSADQLLVWILTSDVTLLLFGLFCRLAEGRGKESSSRNQQRFELPLFINLFIFPPPPRLSFAPSFVRAPTKQISSWAQVFFGRSLLKLLARELGPPAAPAAGGASEGRFNHTGLFIGRCPPPNPTPPYSAPCGSRR